MHPDRIFDAFPAPSYRGTQREALADIESAFEAGNDVVLIRAPTGSGKSLLARAIAGCARTIEEAAPSDATGAYYTTPQVSQLDDVASDDLLEDLRIIRGKRNYDCILPGEENTPVNRAPCARVRGYDCAVKHRCPYFSDRAIASNREIAAMTLAYFMRTAGSDVFRKRDVVVIDEAHGLAEWAEMYATIDLNPRTVPIWDDLKVPEIDVSERRSDGSSEQGSDGGLDRMARYAEQLVATCERRKDELLRKGDLSAEEAGRRDRLQELRGELKWFLEDYRNPDSPTTWVVDQPDGEGGAITLKPMDPERYLHHTVWDRGDKFALLSATILNKDAFCRQVGLNPDRVALVDVEHTFPVENRPLYDVAQGKMTYEHRDETLPKIARLIVRIMANHPDEKGLIHAHSYDIAGQLADRLSAFGVGDRLVTHEREDRDAQLESWKARDDASVFVAVKMEEALDLKGDLARWQVLCKAPFLNTGDSRVAYRLEEGQWAWYYRSALRTVIQACGRVVRAPDDYGATYVADSSLLDLFDRAKSDIPPWFGEQVERMAPPDLPEFDPEAALAGMDGATVNPSSQPQSQQTRTERDDDSEQATGSVDKQSAGGGGRRDRGGSRRRKSPTADVWDVD